jgi:hypothetical protein
VKVINLLGCALTDTQFTLDPAIWGEEVSWNVTRIQRDACEGAFGPPEVVPMSLLPPMTREHSKNIEWERVHRLLLAHASRTGLSKSGVVVGETPLDIPVLQVLFVHRGDLHRLPIDGNHRITARQFLGMQDFRSFIVPEELEGRYRITMEEVDA